MGFETNYPNIDKLNSEKKDFSFSKYREKPATLEELEQKIKTNGGITFAEYNYYETRLMMEDIANEIIGKEDDIDFVRNCKEKWVRDNAENFSNKYRHFIKKAA